MKPNDCDLLSDGEYTSNIENNSVKRSFSKTNESNMSDDDISCKKKKVDKNFQEDTMNSILTTSNGYMTRNRLKKELTDKTKLKIDEFSKHCEPRNKPKTGKRIRNPVKTVQNNKLKLGYVFTHDIFPEKQSGIQHKKNISSLFESDSEPEIESYHLNERVKNEVKKEPISTSELESTPTFNKNIEVKTYFNKKTCSVNNISIKTFSDILEERNQTKTSSSFSYQGKNYIDSNECEKISQNVKAFYEPLEIAEPPMNVEDSFNDERIIVTDTFIRELEKEILVENTFLQDVSETQELSHEINAVKSVISKTEHNLNSKVNSLKPGENSLELLCLPKIKEICCDTNNFKSDFSNIELLDTEMISSNSIVPSLDYNNLKLKSKCQCKAFYSFNKDANKILTSKIKHFAFNKNAKKVRQKLLHQKHLEANSLKMLITEDKKNIPQLNMCLPTINSFPMSIKHEKCINVKQNHINEPSILNMLKDVYEDRNYIPKYNNKSPKLQKNNEINVQASIQKPTDNKSGNDLSIFTINSRLPIENLVHLADNNDVTTNFKLSDENCVNMAQNKISDDITLSCFTKHKNLLGENKIANVIVSNVTTNNENHDKNCLNFGKNKITDNINSSNTTTNHKDPCDANQFNDTKNKSSSKIYIPSTTKNKKLCKNSAYFDEDKNTCEALVSKSNTNTKINGKSHLNFGENEIADKIVTSNISTNKILSYENLVNSVEYKSCDKITIPSVTKNRKLLFENSTNFNKDDIAHEDFESKITANNKIHSQSHLNYSENKIVGNIVISSISPNRNLCNENLANFVESKISDNIVLSKTTCKNKKLDDIKNKVSDNIISSKINSTKKKLNDENLVNFVKNKTSDDIVSSKIITAHKKLDEENFVNVIKNKISDNFVTSKIISTNEKLEIENLVNFVENKISDNIVTSKITPTNENQTNFVENKISDNTSLSCITKNKNIPVKNAVYFDENKIDDNIIISSITTNDEMHDDEDLNLYKNKMSEVVFSGTEKNAINFSENDINFGGKNKISDCKDSASNISEKIKPENVLPLDENFIDSDYALSHSIIEKTDFDFDDDCKSYKMNFNFNTNGEIKIEENSIYNENYCFQNETVNHDLEIEIKPLDSSQLNNATILSFSTDNNIEYNQFLKSKPENISMINTVRNNSEIIDMKPTQNSKYENETDYLSNYVSKQPNTSLFDIPNVDFENSLSNCSSDDENKLQIDFEDKFEVNKNSTPINLFYDKEKTSSFISNLPNENNKESISKIELSKNEMMYTKNKKPVESSIALSYIALKPILLKEELDAPNINENESSSVSKIKNYFSDCITEEKYTDSCGKILLNDDIKNKNEYFSKNIQEILKEMYVNDTFVTACQHMIEPCDHIPLKNDPVYFQTTSEHVNVTYEKKVCDVETQNDVKIINSELSQSIQTNPKTLFKFNMNNNEHENNKSSNVPNKTKNVNSKQKSSYSKSNMKIRIIFREFIKSNKPINEILESKEFRNLRFFKEEEIACSIGAFIFEQIIEPPTITGLSSYKVNCDQLSYEEKNKFLGSTNLNIICPKIMKLTTITLALVKMLRSDSLIDLILNVIRKNLLNKQMNMYHTIDSQLITQTVYYVDICTRLRLLKNLQTFIFDSMVFIPNKYCCVIFISLLLWKNCLPRFMNNEQDPVIITVMSYLIAKKKFYSEQIAGCDIFQRELINLLSFHFNYQFSTDLPVNFIQHIHKPDFFVSVVMFIKCCNPKDLTEFMVNCLFPIIEDYLKTQQNESNALKTMESIIIAIRPFKITCNATVATYLKKYKGSINSSKKDEKDHVYDIMYNNYRAMQDKFIEYLNHYRSCSQSFEESLVSLIMVLGSVDYLSSCLCLMKWKPKFEPSAGLLKKIDMFKSIIGHNLWNKLSLMDDTDTIKCSVNSCLLKKDVYTTIVRLHALC